MVELFSRGNKESAQRRTVVGAAGGECLPRDPGSESRKEGDWRSSAKILDGTDPPPRKSTRVKALFHCPLFLVIDYEYLELNWDHCLQQH